MIKTEKTAYELSKTNEQLFEKVEGVDIVKRSTLALNNEEKVEIFHEELADERAAVEGIYKRAEECLDGEINKNLHTSLLDKIKWLNENREEVKTAIQALGTGMPDDETFYNYYKWISPPDPHTKTQFDDGDPIDDNTEAEVNVYHAIDVENYIEIGCNNGGGNYMHEPQGVGRYSINDALMNYFKGFFTNGFCIRPQTWDNANEIAHQYTRKINDVDIRTRGSISSQESAGNYQALGSTSATSLSKGLTQILVDYDYVTGGNSYSVTNQAFISSDVIWNWTDCARTNYAHTPDITQDGKKTIFKFSPICRAGGISTNAWTSMTIKSIKFYFAISSSEKILLQEFSINHTITRGDYPLTNPFIKIYVTQTIDSDFLDDRKWLNSTGVFSLTYPYLNFLNYFTISYYPSAVAANNPVWASRTKTSQNFTSNTGRFVKQWIDKWDSGDKFDVIKEIHCYKLLGLTGNDTVPIADYPQGVWVYLANSSYGAQGPDSTPYVMCKVPEPEDETATAYYIKLTFNYHFNTRGEGGGGGGGYVPTVEKDIGDEPSAYTPNADNTPKSEEQVEEKIENLPAGTTNAQDIIVEYVFSRVGVPYYSQLDRFGPASYDCSGLAYMACKAAGIDIEGYDSTWKVGGTFASAEACGLYTTGKTFTDRSQLLPGDLVFYSLISKKTGTWSQPNRFMKISHVAIYVGDGMVCDMSGSDVVDYNGTCKHRSIDSNSPITLFGRPWG